MFGRGGKGGKAAALLQLLGLVLGASEDGKRTKTAERKEQCYRCQKLGHVAKYCRNAVACFRCAQAHDSRHCAKKDATRCCANCGGPHAANYRGCSYIKSWSRDDKVGRRHKITKKADTAEAVASSPPPASSGSVVADDVAVPPDAVSEACARVRAAADEEIAALKAAMAEERATLQAELAEARLLVHSLRDALASQPLPAQKKDADTQTAAPVEPVVIQEATRVEKQEAAAQTIVVVESMATQTIMEEAPCPLSKTQLQKVVSIHLDTLRSYNARPPLTPVQWEALFVSIEQQEQQEDYASQAQGARTAEDSDAANWEDVTHPKVSQADTHHNKKKKKDKKRYADARRT